MSQLAALRLHMLTRQNNTLAVAAAGTQKAWAARAEKKTPCSLLYDPVDRIAEGIGRLIGQGDKVRSLAHLDLARSSNRY